MNISLRSSLAGVFLFALAACATPASVPDTPLEEEKVTGTPEKTETPAEETTSETGTRTPVEEAGSVEETTPAPAEVTWQDVSSGPISGRVPADWKVMAETPGQKGHRLFLGSPDRLSVLTIAVGPPPGPDDPTVPELVDMTIEGSAQMYEVDPSTAHKLTEGETVHGIPGTGYVLEFPTPKGQATERMVIFEFGGGMAMVASMNIEGASAPFLDELARSITVDGVPIVPDAP